jgi:hypothetical protein
MVTDTHDTRESSGEKRRRVNCIVVRRVKLYSCSIVRELNELNETTKLAADHDSKYGLQQRQPAEREMFVFPSRLPVFS